MHTNTSIKMGFAVLFLGFSVFIVLTSALQPAKEKACTSKPWFHLNKMGDCVCGDRLGNVIKCSGDNVSQIKRCFCMTAKKDKTVVAVCPYTCVHPQEWNSCSDQLNDMLCNKIWNRQDKLCSQCIPGHGPLVYSYSVQCIPCSPDVVRKSVVFFLVSFLPLTVFCLAIITLRISGARPPMSTFILVSQVMASPQYMSLVFQPSHVHSYSRFVTRTIHDTCWKMFSTFFGLWNLDLFRSLYPQMCFSPHMSTLQVNSIEYVIALYPLLILLLVSFCLTLYSRGYRLIFCVCRPLMSLLARVRQSINIRTSLIDAFATFIIISVNKVGYISLVFLRPSYVISPNGSYTLNVYIDPNLPYFGWHHLPYALTALALTIVLILIPLLLLFLYPLRSFQTFLNNHHWQCSTLHIFADTFQGCYKNGTNGTRDYRWFAGLHLLLRFIVICFFDLSNYYNINAVFMTLTVSFYMFLLSILQPYKKMFHMKIDLVLLFGLLLWCTALLLRALYNVYNKFDYAVHLGLVVLASLVPSIYFAAMILYWLTVVRKLHVSVYVKLRRVLCLPDWRRLRDLSA